MKGNGKIDLYQENRAEYAAPRRPLVLSIEPARYLAISGQGKPGGERFHRKLGALYGVAFTIKMARKFAGRDFAVSKLEGLWWAAGGPRSRGSSGGPLSGVPPSRWRWKLLIRIPTFITGKDRDQAIRKLKERGKGSEVAEVRIERLAEGRCVQVLHLGPYDREPGTIAAMISFAEAQGLAFHGLHHDIYLSDPRRVAPAKLRTILRHPVRRGRTAGRHPAEGPA
jgi:hypothetical protein